jgi:hypothetical protein
MEVKGLVGGGSGRLDYGGSAAFVLSDGRVHVFGSIVGNDSGGVRPVLWLSASEQG